VPRGLFVKEAEGAREKEGLREHLFAESPSIDEEVDMKRFHAIFYPEEATRLLSGGTILRLSDVALRMEVQRAKAGPPQRGVASTDDHEMTKIPLASINSFVLQDAESMLVVNTSLGGEFAKFYLQFDEKEEACAAAYDIGLCKKDAARVTEMRAALRALKSALRTAIIDGEKPQGSAWQAARIQRGAAAILPSLTEEPEEGGAESAAASSELETMDGIYGGLLNALGKIHTITEPCDSINQMVEERVVTVGLCHILHDDRYPSACKLEALKAALRCQAGSPFVKQLMLSAGMLQSILLMLAKPEKYHDFLPDSANMIRGLARVPKASAKIADNGGIKLLIKLLPSPTNALVGHVIGALINLLNDSTENQALFVYSGGVDEVLKLLTNSNLGSDAVTILLTLSENSVLRDTLVKDFDVHERCKQAMHANPTLALDAELTVANLVGAEDTSQHRLESIDRLKDALDKTLAGDAINLRYYSPKTLMLGLHNLSKNDSAKRLMAEGNVLLLLMRIIRSGLTSRDGGEAEICNLAVQTLWQCAFIDENKKLLINLGAIALLKELLKSSRHAEHTLNVTGALFTLGELGQTLVQDSATVAKKAKVRPKVMLSYNWTHQQAVLSVLKHLKARLGPRLEFWIDVEKMQGSIIEKMADAVESSAVVLMCASSFYKQSSNCRLEAEYAQTQKKQIIPLLVEPGYQADGWLGILMGAKLYYDVSSAVKISDACNQLADALEGLLLSGEDEEAEQSDDKVALVCKWSVESVGKWLHMHVGLSATVQEAFRTQCMNGSALVQLSLEMQAAAHVVDEVHVARAKEFDGMLQTKLALNAWGEMLAFKRALGGLLNPNEKLPSLEAMLEAPPPAAVPSAANASPS